VTPLEDARPLRVGLLGTSPRDRDRYASLFAGLGGGACVVVDAAVAEVVLVDLDDRETRGAWGARSARPPVPYVLIAAPGTEAPADVSVLRKPVSPGRLLARLGAMRRTLDGEAAPAQAAEQAAGHEATVLLAPSPKGEPPTERPEWGPALARTAGAVLAAEVCGEAEDIDPGDPAAVAQLLVPGEGRVLGAAREAAAQAASGGRAWAVRIRGAEIVLQPDGGPVRATLTPNAVRGLCQAEPQAVRVSPAAVPLDPGAEPGLPAILGGSTWETTEAFLWQVALWTYRGRLPAGTAIHGRVYLARWPNLSRLAETPHALRIAAFWSEQPATLPFTARALGIPQRFVFAFYGAAHAIGLAGQARRRSDYLLDAETGAPDTHRPLIAAAVARLRGLVRRPTSDR
jgi:hypothetical protein